MDAIATVERMISAKQAEVGDLQGKLKEAEERIKRALLEAGVLMSVLKELRADGGRGYGETGDTPSRRGPKGVWRSIIVEIGRAHTPPATFTIDAVEAASEMTGSPVSRTAIRSQLSNYTAIGLVERVTDGNYRLTDAAMEIVREGRRNNAGADTAAATDGDGADGVYTPSPEGENAAAKTAASSECADDDPRQPGA